MVDFYVEENCKFNDFDTQLNNKSECQLFNYKSNPIVIGYAATPLCGGILLETLGGQRLYGALIIVSLIMLLIRL